jgi:hypothetical protein
MIPLDVEGRYGERRVQGLEMAVAVAVPHPFFFPYVCVLGAIQAWQRVGGGLGPLLVVGQAVLAGALLSRGANQAGTLHRVRTWISCIVRIPFR